MQSTYPALESPQARAERLMGEVNDDTECNPRQLRHLLKMIGEASCGIDGFKCVDQLRRGDVFVSKECGGKVRPWIALRVADGLVNAVAMSSADSAPRLVPSRCRFWPTSWIGTTVSIFHEKTVRAHVTFPYTDLGHLREIEADFVAIMGFEGAEVCEMNRLDSDNSVLHRWFPPAFLAALLAAFLWTLAVNPAAEFPIQFQGLALGVGH